MGKMLQDEFPNEHTIQELTEIGDERIVQTTMGRIPKSWKSFPQAIFLGSFSIHGTREIGVGVRSLQRSIFLDCRLSFYRGLKK